MAEFSTVSEIGRSKAEVFAFIVNLSNWKVFRGYGPLPGIVEASLPEGTPIGAGARVKVRNTDGSEHDEVVELFEPDYRYQVRMDLSPPASWLLDHIREQVRLEDSGDGKTRITRLFVVTPKSILTAPLAWIIAHFLLRKAILLHDDAVKELLK